MIGAARCSIRVADVGRVVEVQFDVGSWRWSSHRGGARCSMRVADIGQGVEVQLDVQCGELTLVEIGKSMSQFLKYIGLNRGRSMWLLAHTASHTWARCCNAKAVCTASRTWTGCCIAGVSWLKSVLAALSRRVERVWWLRLNCVLGLRTKWTNGETMVKVCQALAHTKSSKQISEARALMYQSCADVSEMVAKALTVLKLCGHIGNGSYGFAVPKLCGCIGDGSKGFSMPKLCTIEQTGQEAAAKIGGILALCRQGSSS